MDQTFSIKNLRILLKEDRKKGGDLEEKYIPAAFAIRIKIHKARKLISLCHHRHKSGAMKETRYKKILDLMEKYVEKEKLKYNEILDGELEKKCGLITKKDFRIGIKLLPATVGGKNVYGVGNSLEQILAGRFIQWALKDIYEIKMPSRDILVSQIKTLALDGVPKYIIKADVEQFYESVSHKELLENIHQSPQLSIVVKRILTRLIKDFSIVSTSNKGLPRGIGISAYLSEIYMQDIDSEIKMQEDIFYFSRYVDDMVLMFSPKITDNAKNYLSNLRRVLNKKGLSLNSKTKEMDLLLEQKGKFEYLGYEFDLSGKKSVLLSIKKLTKYRERIKKSFADYVKKSKFIPEKSANELIVRILFLTGNIRLFNRKSNAFIGVYFSNKYITTTDQLGGLDLLLQAKIATLTDIKLKRKLSKFSFERGFSEKVFRNFSSQQLSEISKGWKHG
jgi:hypothetical protein